MEKSAPYYRLCASMMFECVRTVTVVFYGPDDGGSIEDVSYDKGNIAPDSISVETEVVHRSFNERGSEMNYVFDRFDKSGSIRIVALFIAKRFNQRLSVRTHCWPHLHMSEALQQRDR